MIPNTGTHWIRGTNLAINYYGNANWAFDNPNFLVRLNAPLSRYNLVDRGLHIACVRTR